MSKLNERLTLIASLSVVAGIVFLAAEMRQNTDMMRAQTRDSITEKQMEFLGWEATNRELAAAMSRAADASGLTELDPIDRRMLVAHRRGIIREWENSHYQYERGLFTSEEFQARVTNWRGAMDNWVFREVWTNWRETYAPSFRAEIDRITLLYLASQVRQNTKPSRAATRQALADGSQRLASDVVENDDIARIMQDAMDGKEVEPHERFRIQSRCYRDLRFWDNAYYQYTEGLLTAEEWDGFRENLRLIFQFPFYLDYWDNLQVMFSAPFRREVNSILSGEQPFNLREAFGETKESSEDGDSETAM